MTEHGDADLPAPPGLPSIRFLDFVERWGVDERSQSFLAGLPPNVQEGVIAGFDPSPGTRSVDAKLNAFARRVAAELGCPLPATRPGGAPTPAYAPEPDGVADFVARWGLDESSEQMLRAQGAALVEEVIAQFAPEPGTRNVNAKLNAFVRAKQGAVQSSRGVGPSQQAVPYDALRRFAETWRLDDPSVQMLKRLPEDVRSSVFSDFNPPGDTQNVNAKLHAFVKKRFEKLGLAFLPGVAAAPPRPSAGRRAAAIDPVRTFVERWGCDTQCDSTLRQLHPDHQAVVIRDFNPPSGTFNINGKLNSFMRSIASRNSTAGTPLESFAQHWGIDDDAIQTLQSLPDALQNEVMAEFDPPAGTMNVSGKLSAFIRSKQFMAAEGGGPTGPTRSRSASNEEGALLEFQARWGLDSDAVNLLWSLPGDLRQEVIQNFQPRSDTWNPSGRLHAFVRARLKELEIDGTFEPTDGVSRLPAEAAGPDRDDVDEFVAWWGLDRSSEDLLRSLSEDVRTHVISSFEPQHNTRNRNAKLATWVRSLQTQMAGGDPKRARLV